MINKIKKKTSITILAIVVFQIFLLMNMTTAQSYLIHKSDDLIQEVIIRNDDNKEKDVLSLGINLLIGFLSIKQIGSVSAQTDLDSAYTQCCVNMKDGSYCQDLASIVPELCDGTPLPMKCDNVDECRRGCCVDPVEGLCDTMSTKKACQDAGGNFFQGQDDCLITECQKGCCVLGENHVEFTTETRCNLLSSQQGFDEPRWENLNSEPQCLALIASEARGACIIFDSCSIRTEQNCLSDGGEFEAGKLCSHPSLAGYNCTRQYSIGCADGLDEIYWYDSCGYRENIYEGGDDEARDRSWNNGEILLKSESCGAGESNAGSRTCGNCNRALSSVCSPTSAGERNVRDGDFICRDLRCTYEDEFGRTRRRDNGESWCSYDGSIGEARSPFGNKFSSDTIGSRHWKYECIDGEIKVEACSDYRGGLCTETEIKDQGKSFSIASCIMNEASICLNMNSDTNMKTRCEEHPQCRVQNVNVDKYFKFDVCVPKYPQGFDFDQSSVTCGLATQECVIYYVKDWKGDWNCEANCDCEEAEFTQKMNDFCVSLGDCGSYVNWLGEGTNNIKVSRAPGISWKSYRGYEEPRSGQGVEPHDLSTIMQAIGGSSGGIDTGGMPDIGDAEAAKKFVEGISGATGVVVVGYTGALMIISGSPAVIATLSNVALHSYATPLVAAAIGAALGMLLSNWLGIQGDAATAVAIAGGIGGALLVLSSILENPLLWKIGVIIFVIVVVWSLITGWGDTKKRIARFECLPWEPPTGEADCGKCNENPLKPCTRYRCQSIGQVCQMINENTENPTCESIPKENIAPVISPNEVITEGFKFQNKQQRSVEIRASDGGCVQEYNPILFSLKTDEFAQCKYSFTKSSNYDAMENNYPLEQNRFSINHTFGFNMFSLHALEVYNVSGDLKEQFGNLNMYVRCIDAWENYNLREYMVNFCINSGPDRTPVNHLYTVTSPENEATLMYGATEVNFTMWVNEPAECRYSFTKNIPYENMTYQMNCSTDLLEDYENNGWPCRETLTNLDAENTLYIKCLDKPWVITPEDIEKYEPRNANKEDYEFTIYVTENPLNITSTLPEGTIKYGFEPIPVDLEVETTGGADYGDAACYYDWMGSWIQFYNTYSNVHIQEGLNLMSGTFSIPVKCEDSVGNSAFDTIDFVLEVDSNPPALSRAYREGGSIELVTNEDAQCYYNTGTCTFTLESGEPMSYGYSTFHNADWLSERTYHIRCEDIWGNENIGCGIIVQPSDLY